MKKKIRQVIYKQNLLWGITTYFSTRKAGLRLKNYKAFRKSSKRQGLPLVTVELAFGDNPFQLKKGSDAEILVQLRSNSVLWQKERLLNIGLEHLPKECRYVCWTDCDVLFADNNWVDNSINLLKKYKAIQPWKYLVYLPQGTRASDFPESDIGTKIPFGVNEGSYLISFPYLFITQRKNSPTNHTSKEYFSKFCLKYRKKLTANRFFYMIKKLLLRAGIYSFLIGLFFNNKKPRLSSNVGLVWCIRRDIITAIKFYDRAIIGGGDSIMAYAMVGNVYSSNAVRAVKYLSDDTESWSKKVFSMVNSDIYYLDGTVYHLWHGDISKRNYSDRYECLSNNNYDPNNDVKIGTNGCLEWNTNKMLLIEGVAKYLENVNQPKNTSLFKKQVK